MEGTIRFVGQMDGMEASIDRTSHTLMRSGRLTPLQNRSLIVLIED